MAVSVGGSSLAALLNLHANGSNDQEGILLGQTISKITDTISDLQINNIKEETTTFLQSFVPCQKLFSFYDNTGHVSPQKLKYLLQHKQKDVIGWYKFRRNSSHNISMREQAIHRSLSQCFRTCEPEQFVLLLVTLNHTANRSTYSVNYTIHQCQEKGFKSVPLNVVNLGEIVESRYKDNRNAKITSTNGQYNNIMQHFSRDFLDSSTQLREVMCTRQLCSGVQQKLKSTCCDIMESEEKIDELSRDLDRIRQKMKPKPKPEETIYKMDVSPVPIQPTISVPDGMSKHLRTSQESGATKSSTKSKTDHFSFISDVVHQAKAQTQSFISRSNSLPSTSKILNSVKSTLLQTNNMEQDGSEVGQSNDKNDMDLSSSPVF